MMALRFNNDFIFPAAIVLSVLFHLIFFYVRTPIRIAPDFSVNKSPNSMRIELVKPLLETIAAKQRTDMITAPESRINIPQPPTVTRRQPEPEKLIEMPAVEIIQPAAKPKEQPAPAVVESLGAQIEPKPIQYKNPAPRYPRMARRKGWEGTVQLKVQVSGDGLVKKITIQSSSGFPILDQEALRTVEDWQFTPGTRHGQSATSWVVIPVHFRLTQ